MASTKVLSSSDIKGYVRLSTEIWKEIIVPNVDPHVLTSKRVHINVNNLDTGSVQECYILISPDKDWKKYTLNCHDFTHYHEGDYITFSWKNQALCFQSWSLDEVLCSDNLLLLSKGATAPAHLEGNRKRKREEFPTWGTKKTRT